MDSLSNGSNRFAIMTIARPMVIGTRAGSNATLKQEPFKLA